MWIDWLGRSVPIDIGGLDIRFDGRDANISGSISGYRSGAGDATASHATVDRDILREQLLGLSDRVGSIVPAEFDDAHMGRQSWGDQPLRGWWRLESSDIDVVGTSRQPGTTQLRWGARLTWIGERPHRWFDVAVRDEAFGTNVPGYQAAWGYPAPAAAPDEGEIVYIDRNEGARQLPTGFLNTTPAPSYTPAAFTVPPSERVVRVEQLTSGAQLNYRRAGQLRWSCRASSSMSGACYVASVFGSGAGAVVHPTPGKTVTATIQSAPTSSWELGNGIVRFRQSATAGRIDVEWFVLGVWTHLRSLSFSTAGAAVTAWRGAQVVRNTHEAATVRLVAAQRQGGSVMITVLRGRPGAYLQIDTPPGDPATAGMSVSMNLASNTGYEHGLWNAAGAGRVILIGRGNVATPTYTLTAATGTIANAVSSTQRLMAITLGGVAGFPTTAQSLEELRAPLVLRESVGGA